MTSAVAQTTDFTRDVLGRYLCNGFDEALASAARRPFDTVVIGGGAFGAVVAQHLFHSDQEQGHRILVLEAGPFLLPEHVQNLPDLGLDVPDPALGDPGPRNEVWGIPWLTDVGGGSVGLAYCLGGRSLFWGGWSPHLLDEETPSPPWPAAVLADLRGGYLQAAADQLGVSAANEFVFGELQNALRRLLFAAVPGIADAIPLDRLPDYPAVPPNPDRATLLGLLGLPAQTPSPPSDADLRNLLKLEAPLAVQSRAPLPGFFALNKFSGVPLLVEASRAAWAEAPGDDADRRVMIVPFCHVCRLDVVGAGSGWTVAGVETNRGTLRLGPGARVVLALGAIENTRLALASLAGLGLANYGCMGAGLQVHLRSNLMVRVPKADVPGLPDATGLQAAALILRARHSLVGGEVRHAHLQITASGLEGLSGDAEAKLYKLIPDVDTIDAFRNMTEDHVVLAVRGVGEMASGNPASSIRLASETDEFGVPRAFVTIAPTADDLAMWDATDALATQVAQALGGPNLEPIANYRDGLGTTYHESATLPMGDSPATSVTNSDARFHLVDNLYATGPVLFPTTGSPNPMLTGVALARRLAEHLV